ncbi:MAG: HAD family hydrolase [Crocinitomicaceae bacterium]
MTNRPQLFFDFDGTLCDSLPGIENGLQHALIENGLPKLSSESLKKMIGIPLRKSLGMFVFEEHEMGSELYESTIRSFRKYYAEKGAFESKLYANVKGAIAQLSQSHELYLVTAKPEDLAISMLEHHGLISYFSGVGGFRGEPNFAKSRLIASFLKDENAFMIGDKPEDIQAGIDQNVQTIAVTYGYGSLEELRESNPNYLINAFEDVLPLLKL